jgi:hypothetical protein
MQSDDPYARIMAFYSDGAVIYSNAFARYDKETMASPADRDLHTIDTRATVLYNIAVATVLIIILTLYITILRRWRTK